MPNIIKNIIWDVDRTLYKSIPELDAIDLKYTQKLLAQCLPDLSEAERLATLKNLIKTTKSSTLALSKLCQLSIVEIAKLNEKFVPKDKYLKPDKKLQDLFTKLKQKGISHYALRNGTTAKTKEILGYLGLSKLDFPNCELGPFTKVIGVFDYLQKVKPDPAILQYFIGKYHLEPKETLAVGDRIEVDLAPAKAVGMQTALVWQRELLPQDRQLVDYVFPTVYDLLSLI